MLPNSMKKTQQSPQQPDSKKPEVGKSHAILFSKSKPLPVPVSASSTSILSAAIRSSAPVSCKPRADSLQLATSASSSMIMGSVLTPIGSIVPKKVAGSLKSRMENEKREANKSGQSSDSGNGTREEPTSDASEDERELSDNEAADKEQFEFDSDLEGYVKFHI